MTLEYIDSFNTNEVNRLEKIVKELKTNFREIYWQTKWSDHEDGRGNPTSYISLVVPLTQYDKAQEIYSELSEKGFEFETSVFDELIEEILKFRNERDWEQFHNPKDLAISLSLEASELLENFQWKSSEEAMKDNIEGIADEIADVVIYAMLISKELDINLEQAIKEKILKNKLKYPIDKSFGSNKKYTDL